MTFTKNFAFEACFLRERRTTPNKLLILVNQNIIKE